jgi:hypothetical protein
MVIPLIRDLQYTIGNITPKIVPGQSLKTLLNAVFRRLWSIEGNKIVAKATLMNPRLNKTAFRLNENADDAEKWICDELCAMIGKRKNQITKV